MRVFGNSNILVSLLLLLGSVSAEESGWATTSKGLVTVSSCYDHTAKAVELLVKFAPASASVDELPWMAIGYRPSEQCRMVDTDKGDSEIILLTSAATPEDVNGTASVYYGLLPALANVYGDETAAVTSTYESLVPLDDKDGFSLVNLEVPLQMTAAARSSGDMDDETVTLHFRREMAQVPEAVPLMYAVGKSPLLGIHRAQACFDVTEFPACEGSGEENGLESSSQSASLQAGIATLVGATLWPLIL